MSTQDWPRTLRAVALVTMLACSVPTAAQSLEEIQQRLDANPALEPLVPVLMQCADARARFSSDVAFFRSVYGANCAPVMVSFGVVTETTLQAIRQQP